MSNTDAVLLLTVLNVAESNTIEGRTRFQKTIYLLQIEDEIPFSFNYKPYFYGPFSEELSETLTDLEALDLLEEVIVPLGNGVYQYNYRLTESGAKVAEKIISKLNEEVPDLITKIRTKIEALNSLSLNEVIIRAKTV